MTQIQIKNKVDKSYDLINSKYKLSIVEQKLVLSIISLVRKEDDEFKNYYIPINQFSFLTDNRNGVRLKKHCKNLMSKPLEIKTPKGWKLFNWFSHIEYDNTSSTIECSISPHLKPYLLQMQENFKSYDLQYILNMQSEYSIRIYEMLKKSEKIGYLLINLVELEELLKVPKSYKRYDNFKKKVLQVSSLELAKYSDIYYDLEELKTGRKVTELKFKIHKNKHNLVEEDDYEFNEFRSNILLNYEGKRVFYHSNLDRNIIVKNSLLVIEESNKIIEKSRAKELWNFMFNHQNLILE